MNWEKKVIEQFKVLITLLTERKLKKKKKKRYIEINNMVSYVSPRENY